MDPKKPSVSRFTAIVRYLFPCRRNRPQDLPYIRNFTPVLAMSGRFLKTFLYSTMIGGTKTKGSQEAPGRWGVMHFDDYVKVDVDHPVRHSKRGTVASRLNSWYATKRRKSLHTPQVKGEPKKYTHVGTIAACTIQNLSVYISDYLRILVANGHISKESLVNGKLPVVLHIDGKREGYSGTRGEIFPILVNFPTARRPGRHISWLPIGVIVGSGSASSWTRLFLELGLGPHLSSLDHLEVNFGGRAVRTHAYFLGDYAAIRLLTRTTRSNIPFPCRAQDRARGIDCQWFTRCPCAYCCGSAYDVYESRGGESLKRAPATNGLISWPINRFLYGTMHAMMHLAGGFVGDVTRLFDQLAPGHPATKALATMFASPTLPQSMYTYDPLYKMAERQTSRCKAQPAVYEAVFEGEAEWESDMNLIRELSDDVGVQHTLQEVGITISRIPAALGMLRGLHYMWRAHVLHSDPAKCISKMELFSSRIDEMWLSIVRVMVPPSELTVRGVTFNANNSGRGIASHIALMHMPRQQASLGVLAPRVSEKGGENFNSFASDIWNRYHLSKIKDKRRVPYLFLRYLILIIFGRAATQAESRDVLNLTYEKIRSLAERRPVRKRWRGRNARRVMPQYRPAKLSR